MAASKSNPNIPKSREELETAASTQCVPVPAGTLLGKMYSGNTSDVCCLCLCVDGKVSRSTTVYLKDEYTEGNHSLVTLARELQLDKIISQNSMDLLCESCINQLSLFYLFKSKCAKLASGLGNFYTFAESTKEDVTVVLPFETIPEYTITKENSECGNVKMEVKILAKEERLDSDDSGILVPIFNTFSTNKQYSNAGRTANEKHLVKDDESDPLKCYSNIIIKPSECTKQSELDKYATVTKCIAQGKSYCSCCLKENQALIEVLETVLFVEEWNEIVLLKDMLFGICSDKSNICTTTQLICRDCLDITIIAYNFKTVLSKSTTIIQNCISCFETFLTDIENTHLSEDIKRIHLNFYEQFNVLISSERNKKISMSAINKTIKPKTKQRIEQANEGVLVTNDSMKKGDELTSACHICGRGFYSLDEVQLHISGKHDDLLYCSYCNQYYKLKDKSLLINHIKNCQAIERPFECDLCYKKCSLKHQIISHRIRHFPKTIKCDYCQTMFWKQKDVKDHNLRMHRELLQHTFECTICRSVFSKRSALKEHKLSHPANSAHTCKHCKAIFKNKSSYYAHSCAGKINSKKTKASENKDGSNVIRGESRIKCKYSQSRICDICGVVLKSHKYIEVHRQKHQGLKQNRGSTTEQDKSICKRAMCDLCGRLFKDTKSVARHVKTYCKITTGKQFAISCGPDGKQKKRIRKTIECEHCNYKTKLKTCLERHINKHHLKIKPYKCSFCEMGFHTMNALRAHKEIHRNALKCNECGKFFKYKTCLKYHMRLHTGERPYSCDLCEEKFLSASRRQEHRTRKHFVPTVQCTICLKFYYTQRSLREHLRKCHSDEPKKTSSEKEQNMKRQRME